MILAVYLDNPKFCNAITILFCVPYSSNDTQKAKDDTKNGENDTKMTPKLNNETPCF